MIIQAKNFTRGKYIFEPLKQLFLGGLQCFAGMIALFLIGNAITNVIYFLFASV